MTTTRDKLERCLARIADPTGEGRKAFIRVHAEKARAEADAVDRRRAAGAPLGPLAGRIISVKDLLDIEGETTTAGSIVLRDAPPATADAPLVARLRRADAVIIGTTNMTEFAYSGLGINPHYGTPGNPHDRSRVPGGSSSGAATSVVDGMCEIAIGSDTGGSIRIPASFCGLVGFKPSQYRVPREGCVPLSTSLDSLGPLGTSVADCALVDAVIAGEEPAPLPSIGLAGLRIVEPTDIVFDDLDIEVQAAYARARRALEAAGATISAEPMPLFREMFAATAKASLTIPEAAHWHRDLFARRADGYDPWVRARIERGLAANAVDYVGLLETRARLVGGMDRMLTETDLLIMPTAPGLAPRFADCAPGDDFLRNHTRALRNTQFGNHFDLCSATLPIPRAGALPVGLMLLGRRGSDRRHLAIAAAIEKALATA